MATIKCREYLPSGVSFVFSMDASTKIATNFTLKELANNLANEDVKMEFYPDFWQFIQMVQEFRAWWGKSMTVNSCYRTRTFNAKCGGASNSLHLKGLALDWSVKGLNDGQRETIKNKWKQISESKNIIGGINYYSNGMHLSYNEGKYFGAKQFVVRDYRGKSGDW